jgi:hypothetical protein
MRRRGGKRKSSARSPLLRLADQGSRRLGRRAADPPGLVTATSAPAVTRPRPAWLDDDDTGLSAFGLVALADVADWLRVDVAAAEQRAVRCSVSVIDTTAGPMVSRLAARTLAGVPR